MSGVDENKLSICSTCETKFVTMTVGTIDGKLFCKRHYTELMEQRMRKFFGSAWMRPQYWGNRHTI